MIKTVSLQTAQKLKDAGFRQDAYFNWLEMITDQGGILRLIPQESLSNKYSDISNYYAAPTTDELLEELPHHLIIKGKKCGLHIGKGNSFWDVRYYPHQEYGNSCHFISGNPGISLPDILAKMWLHLKSEGLLENRKD